jgi:hypothetical protein
MYVLYLPTADAVRASIKMRQTTKQMENLAIQRLSSDFLSRFIPA